VNGEPSAPDDPEDHMYRPSMPGYRTPDSHAINAAACHRDRIPCAWCGGLIDDHGFDTYCRKPRRPDLGLKPY
jgi:hypothetical protein